MIVIQTLTEFFSFTFLQHASWITKSKNTADYDGRYKNLALSSNHKTYIKGRLNVYYCCKYDFEPTFIICFVIRRVLPDQPK
jgi:hypothetical protein